MKRIIPFVITIISLSAHAQVISKFTWDANPVTKAAIGPDAISVSSAATSAANGVGGTNGLNPGTPTQNVDLTLPGSPYFDVKGIDISVSFRKEENQASFFTRGSNFDFGFDGGALFVKFSLGNGSPAGGVVVNSGNIYTPNDDHAFHVYRFSYDNTTGIAKVWVDNTVVYTYTGTAGRPMNWLGAGNAVIGTNMDATGRNIAVLDNLIIQNPAVSSSLPLKLLSFTATAKNNTALLSWSTTQEVNTSRFVVERSADGAQFIPVNSITANGQFNGNNDYQYTDSAAIAPTSYYRLKMIDADNSFTYSPVEKISFGAARTTITCYPNPTTDFVNIRIENTGAATYRYTATTLDGKTIAAAALTSAGGTQQVTISLGQVPVKGMLVIQVINTRTQTQESFKIMKQ